MYSFRNVIFVVLEQFFCNISSAFSVVDLLQKTFFMRFTFQTLLQHFY